MTHGRDCPKSMLLLGPEIDLQRGPSFPCRPWQRREHSSPQVPKAGHLHGGGGRFTVLPSAALGMTQSSLGAAATARFRGNEVEVCVVSRSFLRGLLGPRHSMETEWLQGLGL